MIGSGMKKIANQYGLKVASGVAYGSLKGFAVTLSEGSGYKRMDITTRFPEFGQQEKFQAALHEVDAKTLYQVQSLRISPRNICVVFGNTLGVLNKVQAFIEWFFPLLEQSGALKADTCLECGTQITAGGWYMINGVAYHMHDACAEHVGRELDDQAQQRKNEDTGSYAKGVLGAFAGAALGSVVWAVVLYLGYVASLVGLLIGWLAEKGYTLLKGKQGKGKIVILVLAIVFGVLLGTLLPDVVTLVQMIGAGELPGVTYGEIPLLMLMLLGDSEYLTPTLSNVGMGLLFAGLGVFALLRRTNQEVTDVKIKKLS